MLNELEQLAANATFAVYVMASPDARETEFLSLKPMASDAERESLAARWPGRGLQGIGVIGVVDGCIHMALKEPIDHIQQAALLVAFRQQCGINDGAELQKGDEVAWLEKLCSLEDNRQEA